VEVGRLERLRDKAYSISFCLYKDPFLSYSRRFWMLFNRESISVPLGCSAYLGVYGFMAWLYLFDLSCWYSLTLFCLANAFISTFRVCSTFLDCF
jgi:hypothetical protein